MLNLDSFSIGCYTKAFSDAHFPIPVMILTMASEALLTILVTLRGRWCDRDRIFPWVETGQKDL